MVDERRCFYRSYSHDTGPIRYLEKLDFKAVKGLDRSRGGAYEKGNIVATLADDSILVIGPEEELRQVLEQIRKLENDEGETSARIHDLTNEEALEYIRAINSVDG